ATCVDRKCNEGHRPQLEPGKEHEKSEQSHGEVVEKLPAKAEVEQAALGLNRGRTCYEKQITPKSANFPADVLCLCSQHNIPRPTNRQKTGNKKEGRRGQKGRAKKQASSSSVPLGPAGHDHSEGRTEEAGTLPGASGP